MERLTKVLTKTVVYTKGKYEDTTSAEMTTEETKTKKTKLFPSDLTEKRFAREWTKACGRIRGNR